MSNKLTKALLIVAFTASPVVAKANSHHAGQHKHSHHHSRVNYHHHQLAAMPPDDLTCLANTIYREARNSDSNLQAVANVAKNRVIGGWGYSYCHVIQTGRFVYSVRNPNQDAYARAQDVARKVMEGELPDNTGGAVFFHAKWLRHLPNWAKASHRTASIDGNVFYSDRPADLRVALE
jgi:spore germination cell wall hydrolase CwlJ-like protein